MSANKCSFHRSLNSLNFGLGIGSCDLEGSHTICDGDVLYCEKPEALANYLHRKIPRQESRMNAEFHEPSVNTVTP